MNNRIIYDLDNTLTLNESEKDYSNKEINPLLGSIHNLEKSGFSTAFYTARNMLSYKEDLEQINSKTRIVAEKWLAKNNFSGPLYVGKPFCGKAGIYVDDRAINLHSHYISIKSAYFKHKIDLIVCFHNAEKIAYDIIRELVELSTLLPHIHIILIDNASSDRTAKILEKFTDSYPFFSIKKVKNSVGYGEGVINGFDSVRSDAYMVAVAHGNLKFSCLDFFRTLCESEIPLTDIVFTLRLNRKTSEVIFTKTLRLLFSFKLKRSMPDSVGGIRIIKKELLDNLNFTKAPLDYLFDIWLTYSLLKNNNEYKSIPLIQRNYFVHNSTWAKNRFAKFKMIKSYLKFFFKMDEK